MDISCLSKDDVCLSWPQKNIKYKQTKSWTFLKEGDFSSTFLIPLLLLGEKRRPWHKSYQHSFSWWETFLKDNLVWFLYPTDEEGKPRKFPRNYRCLIRNCTGTSDSLCLIALSAFRSLCLWVIKPPWEHGQHFRCFAFFSYSIQASGVLSLC